MMLAGYVKIKPLLLSFDNIAIFYNILSGETAETPVYIGTNESVCSAIT